MIQFKGHGGRALTQFRVARPSTMYWTNSGSFFQISSWGGYCNDGSVTSEDQRGTSYIPPGRYQELRVAAIGNWTITIRPGVEGVGSPITFSGSGGKALPPFRLRSGKTMYWTNTGTIFQTYPTPRTGRQRASSAPSTAAARRICPLGATGSLSTRQLQKSRPGAGGSLSAETMRRCAARPGRTAFFFAKGVSGTSSLNHCQEQLCFRLRRAGKTKRS